MLPKTDEELLNECRVTAFRASGSGGQHVNVTDSAVRLLHLPTGIVVTSQAERSQLHNKKECLLKLREKVARLNYRKPKRIATKKSFGVKVKERLKKERASAKKRARHKESWES